jgi:hypothetical protein
MLRSGRRRGRASVALIATAPLSASSIGVQWPSGKGHERWYRVESADRHFTIIDAAVNQVGVYPTEEAARQAVERGKKQDAMLETATLLLENAIKAHMQIHGVDHDTALYWIRSASEVK